MTSEIIQGPYPDVEIPDLSLPAFVLAEAMRHADKPALIDGRSGRTLTYGQLAAGVQRVAAGLAERGLGKGDVLAIYSPNVPEYALAFYGATAAGGIVTTVNPLYTVDELAFQLQDTSARYLLTAPAFLDHARQAASRTGVREVLLLGEGSGATPFAALLRSQAPPPSVAIDPAADLAALLYSSGTTGLPKGVMLTHRNLVATVSVAEPVLAHGPDAVLIGVLPFFHGGGLAVLLGCALRAGATMVTMPRFDLEEFLRLLQDYRVTHAPVVPPLVLALANHPLVDHYDLSALRLVGSGAAPLGADLQDACAGRLGTAVVQAFGMTEGGLVAASPLDAIRPGSAGVLLPNTQARVVDPLTGADLPRGATGELWIRGPGVMRGYLHHPEVTARMLDADGWLRSGDLGYADADGYLYVVDRLKELIKYKGFQVAPAELEAVLLSHPGIADAGVIGSPDREAGEVPKAFVVARSALTAEQVTAFVAERVAPHKKIRLVEFVDEIPKTPAGKILRRVLTEQDRSRCRAH